MQLSSQIKEQVSLVDLLSRLGYQPVRTAGQEILYLSMIRDSDTKPSFAVNDGLGVWYDHGLGKGGNIIDFGLAYWKMPFQEVLEKIMQVIGQQLPVKTCVPEAKFRKRSAVKIPHYEIQEIKELGNNPAITEYLQSRCVWEAAQGRLKEIYYYVEDQKRLRKYFFAAGWQNELGSWEVRNLYFKGCLGHKALTLIPGDTARLAVFEGYFNYLSWLTENPLATDSVLILNSIALIQGAIRKARDYQTVSLFFDRDPGGQGATLEFKKSVPQAKDCSHHYLDFNDYNDKLIAQK
jgi:DNA primase